MNTWNSAPITAVSFSHIDMVYFDIRVINFILWHAQILWYWCIIELGRNIEKFLVMCKFMISPRLVKWLQITLHWVHLVFSTHMVSLCMIHSPLVAPHISSVQIGQANLTKISTCMLHYSVFHKTKACPHCLSTESELLFHGIHCRCFNNHFNLKTLCVLKYSL